MNREIRKGITTQEVNKSLLPFVSVETLVISSLATYGGVTFLNWNGFATFIITAILFMVMAFTPLYPVLGIFFSLGWGYIGYKLFQWITTLTGGGNGIAITIGIFGFLLGFLFTIGMRMGGKEYLDDIQ